MRQILLMKASLYGICDADLLTDEELLREVTYVSLSREGRAAAHKERNVVRGITRVTMPDPVYIPIRKQGVTTC